MPCNQRSLLELSLCSRRFQELLESTFYDCFYHNESSSVRGVHKFLRKILARADLAQRVKVFHADASDSDRRIDMACFKEDDWVRIRNKVADVSQTPIECDKWVKSIEEGNWEAIAALILTVTPNLQVLEFEGWGDDDEERPILESTLDRVKQLQNKGEETNPLALRNLKKVVLVYWYWDTEGGMNIDALAPFLTIPSVETFWARRVTEEYWGSSAEWPNQNMELANIKELSLQDTCIKHDSLKPFLRCFPNLKRLYYSHASDEACFEPPRLMAALTHLKLDLQDLTIVNRSKMPWATLDSYPIDSFVTFQNLRRIKVDWTMLTGEGDGGGEVEGFPSRQNIMDAVPASLEELHVTDTKCHDVIALQISQLIEQKRRFPQLKQVTLGGNPLYTCTR